MKIKTIKGIKEVKEVFPDLETLKKHILKLDKNIRYDNETIKKKIENLMFKLEEQEGVISLSLMRGWLVKNYNFKTKKWCELEYWVERGWNKENALIELDKRNKEVKQRNPLCEEYWVKNGLSSDDAKNKIFDVQSKNSKLVKNRFICSKENLKKNGFSDIEIKNITSTPITELYWVNKGYSIDDAKFKISELQKENSKKLVLLKKNNPNHYSATTQTQLGYWLNKGYSTNESKLKLSERQKTFSKEICVEKYGEEIGLLKFTERQNKWSKSLSTNGNLKIGYSKISQELFNKLLENYDVDVKNTIYFATHNKEYKLNKCESEGGIWLYDFTDTKNKKIIEFNGDMFHGNPNKYKSDDYPHPFRKHITAQEMWDKDKRKLDVAIENGFEVLVIWDSEYRWGNKQEIIDKCVSFLKNK
jgi:hypothetical protein